MTTSSTSEPDNTNARIQAFIRSLDNPLLDMDYRPGLERVKETLAHFSLRRPKLRIRIAGTNGKGSTGYFLESAFRSAGFSTGFYTSPHMLRFNERIRINGEPATDAVLTPLLTDMLDIGQKCGVSPFELATALAIHTFSQQNVDIEILECGLGARLDATTAVAADMALITAIALDHQAWLGDTVEEISAEKAYVMQDCRYAISAAQSDVVAQVLHDFNPHMSFCYPPEDEWNDLKAVGQFQQTNASLAFAAIKLLGHSELEIDLELAHRAISNCVIPGRLQHIQMHGADIWLDAAHNRHAVEALLPSLPGLADPFDAILVFTREDRSLTDVLPLLKPFARKLISRGPSDTAKKACQPVQALVKAIDQYPGGSFLVLGSFTTVAAILRQL